MRCPSLCRPSNVPPSQAQQYITCMFHEHRLPVRYNFGDVDLDVTACFEKGNRSFDIHHTSFDGSGIGFAHESDSPITGTGTWHRVPLEGVVLDEW